MNKKILSFAFVFVFAMALTTAGLVNYLSNTVEVTMDINSPITITILDGEDPSSYLLNMYAGESKSIDVLTEIHIDGVTGHISESKIEDFDGEGLTIEYRVEAYPGIFQIPVCISGDDAYFYIGDPNETLDEGEFESTVTFIAALNLDPEPTYNVESRVIMEDQVSCDYDAPVFVADIV